MIVKKSSHRMTYNAPSGVHEIRGISDLDRPERSEDRTRMGSNPCHPTQKGHPLGWPHIMRLQGFEPWTNRLRVYCSTNWAKGAYVFNASAIITDIKLKCKYFWKKVVIYDTIVTVHTRHSQNALSGFSVASLLLLLIKRRSLHHYVSS